MNNKYVERPPTRRRDDLSPTTPVSPTYRIHTRHNLLEKPSPHSPSAHDIKEKKIRKKRLEDEGCLLLQLVFFGLSGDDIPLSTQGQ
mmetsp:Transcript_2816/g.3893  ORF Transcript_2816/g.3893 Transcript_2816/m.3893 type:complete len:87 (-) Transcript_2816:42-302(-)